MVIKEMDNANIPINTYIRYQIPTIYVSPKCSLFHSTHIKSACINLFRFTSVNIFCSTVHVPHCGG